MPMGDANILIHHGWRMGDRGWHYASRGETADDYSQ
jgi:hypothetical protein